jgi:2-octaprenyl-6-methoxyphenol hydroxylase
MGSTAFKQMERDLNPSLDCHALIAGGGPVGLMLSLGLAQAGFQVALVERAARMEEKSTSFDGRVLALSQGSREALEQLEVWSDLEPWATPITHVHVSQKGYLGVTRIHAEELKVPALGYSVTAQDLGEVLWEKVEQTESIRVIRPAQLEHFEQLDDHIEATLSTEAGTLTLKSQLIVGADGTESQVRKVLGLPIEEKAYQAFGLIAKIESEQAPDGWAFERFTQKGPVALLPMGGNASKAVLVCPDSEIEHYKSMNDAEFINAFAEKMGERLGRFTSVSERVAYPLKETYVPQMTKGRAILLGNASHTQHPVAAQGLNLGIRDVEAFVKAMHAESDLGHQSALESYAERRRPDHEKVMGMTDGLIQIFQADSSLLGHLRGLGLMAMEAVPPLKRRFAQFAMRGVSS